MAFLTRLSPLVQASSRMQLLPTTSSTTSSTCLRLISTSPTSTIRFTCPMAKAPTMSQVKIFCENNAIVWRNSPGWSWRSRDPKETGQGAKEIITKISYQLFGLRWTCILSKRQRRGTRRGLKCTGAWDFNFCCDAQSDLHVFAGRFFRRKDWLIAGICFGLVRLLFTESYTCFIHDTCSPQVSGIYAYTIFAIQQERFLDDFDMPEEIDRTKKD